MYKKNLFIAIIFGIVINGFAQEQAKPKSSELRKAAIEQAVSQKHDELMGNMKKELNSTEKIKKSTVKFRKAGRGEKYKFLFVGDVQDEFGIKKPNLKKVYKYLLKSKPQVTTEFSFDSIGISKHPSVKKGKSFTVKTKSDVKTVVKKDGIVIGETSYDVTFAWKGRVAKNKKTGNYNVKCIKLTSVNQERNFDKEMMKMKKSIEELIKGYYNDLEARNWNAVFAPEIPDIEVVKPLLQKSIEIKRETNDFKFAAPDPQSETFTTSEKEVPVIEIYLDPTPYFKDESYFYPENAKAYHLLDLTFTIDFDKDYNGKLTKVEYKHLGFNPPKIDEGRRTAWRDKNNNAQEVANNFKNKMEICDNPKVREDVLKMFAKDGVVEVSFVNGEEKIKTRNVREYLSNLRCKKMTITFEKKEILNNDINNIVYTFLQKYTGKFTDCTNKKLYLKYDEKVGKYFIEKVEVVKGSTVKCEE